jgi:hypothetical protein
LKPEQFFLQIWISLVITILLFIGMAPILGHAVYLNFEENGCCHMATPAPSTTYYLQKLQIISSEDFYKKFK